MCTGEPICNIVQCNAIYGTTFNQTASVVQQKHINKQKAEFSPVLYAEIATSKPSCCFIKTYIFLLLKRPFCNIWIALLLNMYFGTTFVPNLEYINIKTQREHTATLQLHARSLYYLARNLKD